MCAQLASEQAFQSRTDLIKQYKHDARMLYALQIKFEIDDIDSVASESLTDASDDKKCDLVYVNRDDSYAVISQSYESTRPRKSAPSNKASDLNTAVTWLLNSRIEEVPDTIRNVAEQLRSAISDGSVKRIYLWYVHNCPESREIITELKMAERSAYAALSAGYVHTQIEVQSFQVGKETLEEWYNSLSTPILVSDNFTFDIPDGYELTGEDWKSYYTAIPASILYQLYRDHGPRLFSANIRDYLGSISSDKNINNNIKTTALEDPGHFSIYNNGLTALVNEYTVSHYNQNNQVTISGISIVNGAQTTGAIGSLPSPPESPASVSIRFVKCSNQDVIWNIIQYNNSQNKITASDFRSNDPIQRRLRSEEFPLINDAYYSGGRRGGARDRIQRRPNLLPSDTVAQALTSFHGDPGLAYNEKSRLWADDAKYNAIFSDKTHANHIVFAYSLLKCIEEYKTELRDKSTKQSLTTIEKEEFDFLRNRGSIYLLHAAIGLSIETIISQPIPDKFRLSFTRNTSPNSAITLWRPIVEATIPFCSALNPAVGNNIKSKPEVDSVITKFHSMIEATKRPNEAIFKKFTKSVQIN